MDNILLGGLNQGMLWGIMAIGVYITFRLLDFADLTCEGSFALGGAVAATLIQNSGWHGISACFIALLAGAGAGLVTALLHTKLKIAPILSGIITLTALYSVTLITMEGKAAIGLLNVPVFYSVFGSMMSKYSILIMGLICTFAVIAACYWFFGTEIGSAIRATGANEKMCRAQGINTDNTKIIGLVLSNALIALSGALVAQEQGTASWTTGQGAIVAGLAAVILGEVLIPSNSNFAITLFGVVIGSIIYRIIYALVYYVGLPTEYIKLSTAVLVVIALCLPMIKSKSLAFAKMTDKYLIKKYPKYAEYAKKRDDKKEAKKQAEKEKLLAEIKSLTGQLSTCTDEKTVRKQHAKLVRAKEKYVEKYGSKELDEAEEKNEAISVAAIGGEDR